jgi:hypothetical protein
MKTVRILSLTVLAFFTVGAEQSNAKKVARNENKASVVNHQSEVPAPRLIANERIEEAVAAENDRAVVPRPLIVKSPTGRSNTSAHESEANDLLGEVPQPEMLATSDPHRSNLSQLSVPKPTFVSSQTRDTKKSAAVLSSISTQ